MSNTVLVLLPCHVENVNDAFFVDFFQDKRESRKPEGQGYFSPPSEKLEK